jgi:hypothetical protein
MYAIAGDTGVAFAVAGAGNSRPSTPPPASHTSPPVRIAHAAFDFTVPPTTWAGIKASLPSRTYRAFKRGRHYPYLQEQAASSVAVTGWLRRDPAHADWRRRLLRHYLATSP